MFYNKYDLYDAILKYIKTCESDKDKLQLVFNHFDPTGIAFKYTYKHDTYIIDNFYKWSNIDIIKDDCIDGGNAELFKLPEYVLTAYEDIERCLDSYEHILGRFYYQYYGGYNNISNEFVQKIVDKLNEGYQLVNRIIKNLKIIRDFVSSTDSTNLEFEHIITRSLLQKYYKNNYNKDLAIYPVYDDISGYDRNGHPMWTPLSIKKKRSYDLHDKGYLLTEIQPFMNWIYNYH